MRLVLFDLDDTLFNGDTEAEWVFYMINNGLIKDQQEFETSMENFEKLYRKGELDVLEFLLYHHFEPDINFLPCSSNL